MQRFDGREYIYPPDLLRRFVATPLTFLYRIGAFKVIVKTNDETLLPAFEASFESPGTNTFEWKLIRDSDSHGLLEPSMGITSGPLTFVGMGPACLIGVDRQRRELFAFIGRDIDRQTYKALLIPLFFELTSEACAANAASPSEGHNQACANE